MLPPHSERGAMDSTVSNNRFYLSQNQGKWDPKYI